MKKRHPNAIFAILCIVTTVASIGIALYLWHSEPNDHQRRHSEGAQDAGARRQPSLSGVVTNCYGEPVTNAAVTLMVESRDHGRAVVDEQGTFSFDGIPGGQYRLRVESETWGSLEEDGTLDSDNDGQVRLSIPGRARVDGRIGGRLDPGVESLGPLRLFRLTESGRELLVGDEAVVRKEDDSAAFTITGIGVGRFVLEAGVLEREFEVGRNGQVIALELTLPTERPIQQRIVAVYGTAYLTDNETSPLANRLLEVDVVRPGGVESGPPRQVYTDAQGAYRFRIRTLERGTILRYSYRYAEPVVTEIEEEVGEDLRFDPFFRLFPLEKVGILTTADHVPVANSRVILHDSTRWTDDDGIFSLDGVGKGSHDVEIWYNRYGKRISSVTATLETSTGPGQPETVALEIDVENAICIQVLKYNGHRPAHGIVNYALAQQEFGAGIETYYRVSFRRPGRIFLAGLPYSGNLRLTTRDSLRPNEAGRPPVMPTYAELEVRLQDLQSPKEVLLQLEGSRFAAVRVVGEDGRPLTGAFATVGFSHVRPPRPAGRRSKRFETSHPNEALARQILVTPRGKGAGSYDLFFYDGLDEHVGIFHPEGATVIDRARFESLRSAAPPRTIRLDIEEFVAGTVQDSQRESVSDCRVELTLASGETRSAETFANGNYFLYAGDGEPEQLKVLPGDGKEVTIESPVPGAMQVIWLE